MLLCCYLLSFYFSLDLFCRRVAPPFRVFFADLRGPAGQGSGGCVGGGDGQDSHRLRAGEPKIVRPGYYIWPKPPTEIRLFVVYFTNITRFVRR